MASSFDYQFESDTSEGENYHVIPSGGNLTILSEAMQANLLFGEFHISFYNKNSDGEFELATPSAGTFQFHIMPHQGYNWISAGDAQNASETDYEVPRADNSFVQGRLTLTGVSGAGYVRCFSRKWGS